MTSEGTTTAQLPRFESLPGELRNRIYRLVAVSDTPINILEPFRQGIKFFHFYQPALSKVNTQIREEVLSIYYAENVFIMQMIFIITVEDKDEDDEFKVESWSSFYYRSRSWIKSCGRHKSSITTIGAADTSILGDGTPATAWYVSKPERILAYISRDVVKGGAHVDVYYEASERRCSCMLYSFDMGDNGTKTAESVLMIAARSLQNRIGMGCTRIPFAASDVEVRMSV